MHVNKGGFVGFVLDDLSHDVIVGAIENKRNEWDADFGRQPPGEVVDGATMLRFDSGIPFWLCNGVYHPRLPSEHLDSHIASTMEYFATRRHPMYWYLGPSTKPAELSFHLLARGLSYLGQDIGMALDVRDAPDDTVVPEVPNLIVRRVSTRETLQQWINVWIVGTDLPRWVTEDPTFFTICARQCLTVGSPFHYYVGVFNGEPV